MPACTQQVLFFLPLASSKIPQRKISSKSRAPLWLGHGTSSIIKLPAKRRVQADDKRRVLNQLWARCRTDSRALGQTRIQLAQREIAGVLEHTGFRIDLAFAVVPADASRMLSRENVAVVVNEARRDLISAHRLGGGRMYLAALAAWRAADSRHQQCAAE